MKKEDLRKFFLAKRKLLSPEDRTYLSRRIAGHFFEKIFSGEHSHIHVFLPIMKFNEVDTWLIVEEFKEKKLPVKIVVSKTVRETGEMINYYYDPLKHVVENKWGIPEPETGEICDNLLIDVVLVPLLAFDQRGHRIGYGKGFYDRFLKTCRKNALKIGLSYEGPVEHIEDADENDVVLDCVITPDKLYWF